MDVSEALNALVCPTAANSDRQKISQATAVLSDAKTQLVILSLSKIAFNEEEPIERREGALVLLRSRLLGWDPSEDEALKQAIQQALSSALMSAKDDLLAWRVASVVSALFCTHSNPHAASWHELCHSAVAYLQSVAAGSEEAADFSALTLIKAIFADGGSLGDMAAPFPLYLKSILSRGWNAQDAQRNKLTCEAVGSVIQSYCVNTPTVPAECRALLTESLKVIIDALENRVNVNLGDMLDVLVATVDVRPNEARLWTAESVQVLIVCLHNLLGPNALAGRQTGAHVSLAGPQVLHIATSAVIALSAEPELQLVLLEPLWHCLVSCLAMPIPGPTVCPPAVVAASWEIEQDCDSYASAAFREFRDGSHDLSMVSWEQIDRILTALEPSASRRRVISSGEKLLKADASTAAGLGELHAGWVLLALLIAAKVEDVGREVFTRALSGWSRCFSLPANSSEDLTTRFAAARVRWGALVFMSELVANYGEALATEPAAIEILQLLQQNAQNEPVPKVKSKSLMTFCQLAGQMETENESLINEYFLTWLLPSLARPRILDECRSLTGCAFETDDEEVMAMEVLLRELVLAAMSTTCTGLGAGLVQHYPPVMSHCLHLLSQAPENAEAASICEAVLEFATRLLECAVILIFENSMPKELERIPKDYVDLLRTIVRLDKAVQNLNVSNEPQHRTPAGLFSASFERTLLQAAARLLSGIPVVESPHIIPEINSILAIARRKLTGVETVCISETASAKPLGAAGYNLQSNERSTTLTLAHAAGVDKVIDINSTLIEEQIVSLSFLGVVAAKMMTVLPSEEMMSLFQLVEDLSRSTILPDVRRNGLECLKEMIEVFAENVREAGREALRRSVEPSEDATFMERLQRYMNFWTKLMQLGIALLKQHMRLRNFNELVYILADISDGGRDAALIMRKKVDCVCDCAETETLITDMCALFRKALVGDDKTSHVRLEDGDDNDDDFGIGADAVMQFVSRVFKAFGSLARPGFDLVKPVFAALLTSEDVSIVARTAALVVFASAADAQPGAEGNEQLLPVALLFARCLDVDSRMVECLRAQLPAIETLHFDSKKNPTDVELLKGCVSKLREISAATLDDEALIERFIDFHQTEVMRVQAAVYAIGVVAQSVADFQIIVNQLPAIEDTFNSLLAHPLACLASRRVILDCLVCAAFKIMLRIPDLKSEERRGLFSVSGLEFLLKTLLPIKDDAEDGQFTHDLLIDWALGGLPNFPQTSSENVCPQMLEKARNCRLHLARILQLLHDEREENGELLSYQAKNQNRLQTALQALQFPSLA